MPYETVMVSPEALPLQDTVDTLQDPCPSLLFASRTKVPAGLEGTSRLHEDVAQISMMPTLILRPLFQPVPMASQEVSCDQLTEKRKLGPKPKNYDLVIVFIQRLSLKRCI